MVVWVEVDRVLDMGRVTAMVLMELMSIGREGHFVGQAFGMGGMTGVACLWGCGCRQGLVPRVGLAPYSLLAMM